VRIGVVIPEFPGQTHIVFWRELRALRVRGVEPEVVSTRPPPPGIVCHRWSAEALAGTRYLTPVRASEAGRLLRGAFRAGPRGWARCLASIARARGVGPGRRARLLALAAMGAQLADIARERGWAHVHCHSCADSAHVVLFAHLLSGIPYSLTLHGQLDDLGANQREKWRHAAFAVVITRTLREDVQRRLAGSLPPVVEVAPMGIDVASYGRRTPYVPWDGACPLRLFSCGRLNAAKGYGELVEAIALLRDEGIDARLTIAGEDEQGGSGYRRTLEALVRERRLRDGVILLGAVSEERVAEALQSTHVFVLGSHHEGLGVATMEAMAMGVPVVVTRVGGVPELVEDGADGILVPPRDAKALASAIARLARAPERARALSAAGRGKVERAFDSARSAEVLERRIRSLATDRVVGVGAATA
jgi:glycosyltransferase involved in cell wall biosynthesis